jgi:hypothetical integral membrane protein (TIGR02206 family)
VWLPWYSRKYLSENHQRLIGGVLGFFVGINYLVWVGLELLAGTFDIKLHLPFQLCRVANMLLPLVMFYKNQRVFDIVYFWGLSGVFQGLITPDITHDFPHFHFFRFWVGHNGMVIAIIYATVVYKMRPTLDSLKMAFIALNLFLFLSAVVNIILDANYFWICWKPPMASLLDFMGPWPWYIVAGELVALIHFILAYLPFYIIDKRRLKFG